MAQKDRIRNITLEILLIDVIWRAMPRSLLSDYKKREDRLWFDNDPLEINESPTIPVPGLL